MAILMTFIRFFSCNANAYYYYKTTAISIGFFRAILSLCFLFLGSILALSQGERL